MTVTSSGALPALVASTVNLAGTLALTPSLDRPGPCAFTLLASIESWIDGLKGLPADGNIIEKIRKQEEKKTCTEIPFTVLEPYQLCMNKKKKLYL